MNQINDKSPDYLVIGHLTIDIHSEGNSLGGTAAYAALCAHALGRKTAIITSGGKNYPDQALKDFLIHRKDSKYSTTFENVESPKGRKQILHSIADPIIASDIPKNLRNAKIVHIGPVADEVDTGIIDLFPQSFIGMTPQGWMRTRDDDNLVIYKNWEHADKLLDRANAVVLSIEDVQGDEDLIHNYSDKTKILVVTEGYSGARVYWLGDVRHFSTPKVPVVDPTGAGDIFAAVFFDSLETTYNPWEAGRRAVQIASHSVTRKGLSGVPTDQEIRSFQIELIEGK